MLCYLLLLTASTLQSHESPNSVAHPTHTASNSLAPDNLVGKYFLFSSSWAEADFLTGEETRVWLRLGYFRFKQDYRADVHYFLFDPNLNRQGWTQNGLNTPRLGNDPCEAGPFRYNAYESVVSFPDQHFALRGENEIIFQVGDERQTWLYDSKDFWTMSRDYYSVATGRNVFERQPGQKIAVSSTKGFGLISDDISPGITNSPQYLAPAYTMRHWQNFVPTDSNDKHERRAAPQILRIASPGLVTQNWSNDPIDPNPKLWATLVPPSQNSMYFRYEVYGFNISPYSGIVYSNNGNLFNGTDCWDPDTTIGGHKRMWWGAWDAEISRFTGFVWIEYSFEADGYPILGTGVYY